jgi:hypothetical protein
MCENRLPLASSHTNNENKYSFTNPRSLGTLLIHAAHGTETVLESNEGSAEAMR